MCTISHERDDKLILNPAYPNIKVCAKSKSFYLYLSLKCVTDFQWHCIGCNFYIKSAKFVI